MVEITVKNMVHISIMSKSSMVEVVSKKPAIMGEIRNFAELDIPTSPLAFVYSSLVSKSVMVALYAGSNNDEKTELIVTPMQICQSFASPFNVQIRIYTMPKAERPSPSIINNLRSNRSARTPAKGLSNKDGRKANKVTIAIAEALPVC